ncbi:glycine/betaine ABC transporter substrate-binding protein [Rhizobium sp. Leaf306]|jgi:glycine betaine/proline transport system substrate-binding protein|uniref:Glycine betaine/proline transport system substrate-binding protein n=2 Tax=Rhizobium/Agrobacterium group TaxID=227290 RepID=A0A7X0MRG3_9HYPH|nr:MULTISPECIES: choline ABC transporter substrate-binding protein [Rhizobium]KQQ36614.1 glycine/betaine ABC transporter substrate-binding protein [Rhizobium sp. Leaf306]MBB6507155.1 glycine betaine/proline transport system substrate-binding protein [Rhizobium soli]MBD8650965.1 choline ABC transporter substrate-binding protein [Rhizobium sp. CFBP 13726]RYE70145.1 MAG: choline ABC transporter substrate-binding protein [Rhizobiaceae bacterium]
MTMTVSTKTILAAAVSMMALSGAASAAEPASCGTVRFSDVGWTDITATTATASVLLKALGYETDVKVLSVPVTYSSLKNKDIDVFLGNWMPTQEADVRPFLTDKSVESIGPNLVGAKYTLATNAKGAELGIKDFKDIAAKSDALGGKIYGIEPGNDGNRLILGMIEKDTFGLKKLEVVESSEQGMLAQVARADKAGEPVVFLGWEPHPMNANFKLTYLTGGDDVFGANFGGAEVYTNVRAGYTQECPNVGTFIKNLKFSLPMENQIMGGILNDGEEPEAAATTWLKANGAAITPWLAGVTTKDGKPAEAAVKAELGL